MTLRKNSNETQLVSPLNKTPVWTPGLIQKIAEFHTLSEGLDYAAQGITGFNFYSPRGQLEHVLPYPALRARALKVARQLLSLGLTCGDRVAVVAETGPEFMTVFFACQYAGLIPCPMPYTMYVGGKDAYVDRVAGMLKSAQARLAISGPDLEGYLREAAATVGGIEVMGHAALRAQPEWQGELKPFGPDDNGYIQYSSGSTSNPKGVLISQRAIIANSCGILRQGMRVTTNDRGFSWLPLYHDMGLVGFCLAPMMAQVSIDYLPTPAFARRPALWLKLMSDNQTTISYSPSFGYELAARRVNGEAPLLDLKRWRIAGIGGDMVRADVLDLFTEKLAVAGFDAKAFMPSYGMAEATLAVTFTAPGTPPRIDEVDRVYYKLARRAVPASQRLKVLHPERVRGFVICGQPLPDHEIVIRDDMGCELGEREIGRVFVKGPSLMSGYFQNPEATEAVLGDDGFLDTGDMGYWLDGEIVITGRAKDLILHNGRNIWPQDIEWSAEQIEPLRDGDVAAFAVEGDDGDDDVVVLVQCRLTEPKEMEELRRKVAASVHRSAGVECQVVLVPPKSLPFTSSGKLSRAGAKARYLAGDIAEVSPVAAGLLEDAVERRRLEAAH
jgi:fatty-acyl-CoA synthase